VLPITASVSCHPLYWIEGDFRGFYTRLQSLWTRVQVVVPYYDSQFQMSLFLMGKHALPSHSLVLCKYNLCIYSIRVAQVVRLDFIVLRCDSGLSNRRMNVIIIGGNTLPKLILCHIFKFLIFS
jgi:hypothetical protein